MTFKTSEEILIELDKHNALKIIKLGSSFSVMIEKSLPYWEEYANKLWLSKEDYEKIVEAVNKYLNILDGIRTNNQGLRIDINKILLGEE